MGGGSHRKGLAALLLVTVAWGTTFPAMKQLSGDLGVLEIILLRFALSSLVLLPLLRGLTWSELRWGAAIGSTLFCAFYLQVAGLALTSSNRNAFVTGLNVLIVPMLAKIGIKVNLELMDRAILTKRRNAGDFDLYDEAWQADLDPDETIRPEWLSGMPWNYVGYTNPVFDVMIKRAAENVDVTERKRLYYGAEDLMMQQDAPIAMLAHTKVYKIFNKRVEGFKYVPVDLMNMHTVYLKKG